mmetsp:Transcript_88806/g.236417  ORF Transcript_88806/g.236417 Transcript_88806/m.236417 type:complete len:214 (-) Transcript_88806:845-1486(-)
MAKGLLRQDAEDGGLAQALHQHRVVRQALLAPLRSLPGLQAGRLPRRLVLVHHAAVQGLLVAEHGLGVVHAAHELVVHELLSQSQRSFARGAQLRCHRPRDELVAAENALVQPQPLPPVLDQVGLGFEPHHQLAQPGRCRDRFDLPGASLHRVSLPIRRVGLLPQEVVPLGRRGRELLHLRHGVRVPVDVAAVGAEVGRGGAEETAQARERLL